MSEQEVIVRRARAEDVPGIVVSSSLLFAEDGGERDPSLNVDWPRLHGAEAFAAALRDPGRLLLAAVHDGEVVGHLSASMAGPTSMRPVGSATLMALYVRPEHRRARVGARLVDTFLAWARERGAAHAEVTASAGNADGIRFYEREAFRAQALTLRLNL
ncbi:MULTISPECIES: GNAT family N-acetyltransferase [Streptomyces]|uniref:GNAT family N-acetyltransferase n=1 Tax=Streptomyces caniscabiei TaxID=2746961 RepID=A0ABU4MVG8_9ACTN|nr:MULTISPECIES: GNAT family N-acetyltransferase [Streptomyces]MBE4733912.1 GNAT family N-acetyltransferase [Streptomyces caniscabiei]MBE4755089.1 GNAT family N-acetyltransferase [Streptomyces caniscabiei]MBE4768091.1 GNAT family N-acetyltransferase [Streptomyces caniscabiei]MBE4782407.1 GNAT family N-acetyltransferase [Streptomyces caniscabiei]MBE4793695.1 GNAT family N-acetyltransferase [Streptomyces caniscabiei]